MVEEGENTKLSAGSVGRLDPATSREGGLKSDQRLTTSSTCDNIPPSLTTDNIPPVKRAPMETLATGTSDAGEETRRKTERGGSPKTPRPKREQPRAKRY